MVIDTPIETIYDIARYRISRESNAREIVFEYFLIFMFS